MLLSFQHSLFVFCICSRDITAKDSNLVCITGRISTPAVYDEISIKIDDKNYSSVVVYNYTKDPTIDSVMPKKTFLR